MKVQTGQSLSPPGDVGKPDKGNRKILCDNNGEFKRAVRLDVAARFGGVGRRAIERAIKKGPLEAEGERQNRVILVQSLLKYFPPEK